MFENEIWLFVSYLCGTVFGCYVTYRYTFRSAVEDCVDKMIAEGYIKSRRLRDGNIEIAKWDEEFE